MDLITLVEISALCGAVAVVIVAVIAEIFGIGDKLDFIIGAIQSNHFPIKEQK